MKSVTSPPLPIIMAGRLPGGAVNRIVVRFKNNKEEPTIQRLLRSPTQRFIAFDLTLTLGALLTLLQLLFSGTQEGFCNTKKR